MERIEAATEGNKNVENVMILFVACFVARHCCGLTWNEDVVNAYPACDGHC